MRISLVTLLCTLGLTAAGVIDACADGKTDVEKELKKFESIWTFESVETGGKNLRYITSALRREVVLRSPT